MFFLLNMGSPNQGNIKNNILCTGMAIYLDYISLSKIYRYNSYYRYIAQPYMQRSHDVT